MTRWPLVLVLPLAVVLETLGAGGARAQSLVDQRPEDPCEAARALDIADTTPGAENVRRACRLQRFQDRLAEERSQQVATQDLTREARVQQWINATQPSRVTHPLAFEGFFGSGLASYGVSFSWDFLRHAELGVWLGWRPISCLDANGSTTSACGRTAYGLRGRWYLLDRDFSPFVATGLSFMSSELAFCTQTYYCNTSTHIAGSGRANTVNVAAGLALALRSFRISIEYVFEYAFYTGASLDDEKKTPSPQLDGILDTSLQGDRNGVRFQAGYAF